MELTEECRCNQQVSTRGPGRGAQWILKNTKHGLMSNLAEILFAVLREEHLEQFIVARAQRVLPTLLVSPSSHLHRSTALRIDEVDGFVARTVMCELVHGAFQQFGDFAGLVEEGNHWDDYRSVRCAT